MIYFKVKTIKENRFYFWVWHFLLWPVYLGERHLYTGSQGKQVGNFARDWQIPFIVILHSHQQRRRTAYFPTASSTEYLGIGIYWNFANLKDTDGITVQYIFLLLWERLSIFSCAEGTLTFIFLWIVAHFFLLDHWVYFYIIFRSSLKCGPLAICLRFKL